MARTTPGKAACAQGARLCVANSARYTRSAEYLAQNGQFGFATAFVILGVEQSAQAYIYATGTTGLRVNQKLLNLRNHEARQALASIMPFIRATGEEVLKEVEFWAADPTTIRRLKGKPRQAVLRELAIRFGERIGRFVNGSAILENASAASLLDSWWKSADRLKQRGLYVDYEDKVWTTPDDVTELEYLDAVARAEPVVALLDEISLGMLDLPPEGSQFLKLAYAVQLASTKAPNPAMP